MISDDSDKPAALEANEGRISQQPEHTLDPPIQPSADVPLPPSIVPPIPPTSSPSSQWNPTQASPATAAADASLSPASRATAERIAAMVPSPSPENPSNPSPLLFQGASAASTSRGVRDHVGAFASSSPQDFHGGTGDDSVDPMDTMSEDNARSLYETYLSYVHPQYPFLCRRELDRLLGGSNHLNTSTKLPCHHVSGTDTFNKCIRYLVLSTGALIFDGRTRHQPSRSELLYNYAQKHYISSVLMGKCLINQTTIHLLLTMRALHDSSSQAIIHHTSAAVRTAITAGLHRRPLLHGYSGSSDQVPHTEQMMRRLWWCCYGLDRAVASGFGHPVSIADEFITTEVRYKCIFIFLLMTRKCANNINL